MTDIRIIVPAAVPSGNMSWTKPTILANGDAITTEVTGYKIYSKSGSYSLHSTISDEDTLSASVPAGTYAVAATFSGGQTALSDPITLPVYVSPGTTRVVGTGETYPATLTGIQDAIDDSSAGDVVQLRGETFNLSVTAGVQITVAVSGTANDPIIIESFPDERAIINGPGSASVWQTHVDENPGTNSNGGSETGIQITGDYIHLKNLDIVYFTDGCVVVRSSTGVRIEGVYAINWGRSARIAIRAQPSNADDEINGFIMRYCRAEFSRLGVGIGLAPVTTAAETADLNQPRIERCISSWNGYEEDFVLTNAQGTGGNSGGGIESVFLHPAQGGTDPHPVKGCVCKESIFYHNADDSLHVSAGPDYLLLNNTMMEGGPMGNRGIKMKNPAFGDHTQIGNIAYNHRVSPSTSGRGFECRMEDGELIQWNNSAIDNDTLGWEYNFTTAPLPAGPFVSRNSNIGYLNDDNQMESPNGTDFTTINNITAADPQLEDAQPTTSLPVHDDTDPFAVQTAWREAFFDLRKDFMPASVSIALDNGNSDSSIHTATAADDATTPADPEADKLAWFGTDPDIGAQQRRFMDPPVLSAS
jgi:hypothetical protein